MNLSILCNGIKHKAWGLCPKPAAKILMCCFCNMHTIQPLTKILFTFFAKKINNAIKIITNELQFTLNKTVEYLGISLITEGFDLMISPNR